VSAASTTVPGLSSSEYPPPTYGEEAEEDELVTWYRIASFWATETYGEPLFPVPSKPGGVREKN
jgi:hypothetical protein